MSGCVRSVALGATAIVKGIQIATKARRKDSGKLRIGDD
jgi:hypothetical protein